MAGSKKCRALDAEEVKLIIDTMKTGGGPGCGFRKNPRIAALLTVQANLGLRLSDLVPYENKAAGKQTTGLKLSDIRFENNRYHLQIVETKTGKARGFTVLPALVEYLRSYAKEYGLTETDPLFPLTERAVQKYLAAVCFFLDLEDVGPHSFRKFFATEIYKNSGYDIRLVQTLLQHSSSAITERYIGISSARVEEALEAHSILI